MVAFTSANLPSSVNTVEELVAWGNSVLEFCFPVATRVEGPGAAVRVASNGIFTIEETNERILICRASLKLNTNFTATRGIWNSVQEIGSAAIPTEFLT